MSGFRTDRTLLRHLLRNLLSNAVKFTESGSVTMTADAGDGVVSFSVRDTGVGHRRGGPAEGVRGVLPGPRDAAGHDDRVRPGAAVRPPRRAGSSAATCACPAGPARAPRSRSRCPRPGRGRPPRGCVPHEPGLRPGVRRHRRQALRHLQLAAPRRLRRPGGRDRRAGPRAGRRAHRGPRRARRAPAGHERPRGLRPDQGGPPHGVDAGGAHLRGRRGAPGPDRRARTAARTPTSSTRSSRRRCSRRSAPCSARRAPGAAPSGSPYAWTGCRRRACGSTSR